MAIVEELDRRFPHAAASAGQTSSAANTAAAAAATSKKHKPAGASLVPPGAAAQARAAEWAARVNSDVIPHYYRALMSPEGTGAREAALSALAAGLEAFGDACAPVHQPTQPADAEARSAAAEAAEAAVHSPDPAAPSDTEASDNSAIACLENSSASVNGEAFFFGDHFSIVDLALAPWMQRIESVLKEYRGFELPAGDCADRGFGRLHAW